MSEKEKHNRNASKSVSVIWKEMKKESDKSFSPIITLFLVDMPLLKGFLKILLQWSITSKEDTNISS